MVPCAAKAAGGTETALKAGALVEYRKDGDRSVLVLLTEPNGKTNWWAVDQVRGRGCLVEGADGAMKMTGDSGKVRAVLVLFTGRDGRTNWWVCVDNGRLVEGIIQPMGATSERGGCTSRRWLYCQWQCLYC